MARLGVRSGESGKSPRAAEGRARASPSAHGPQPGRARAPPGAHRPPTPAHLHAVEPGLQPELLNHLLHGGDARRTRHGTRDSRADESVRPSRGRRVAGRRGRGSELGRSFRGLAARAAHARRRPSLPRPARERGRRGGAAGGRGGDGGGAARRPAGAFRVRRGWVGRGKRTPGPTRGRGRGAGRGAGGRSSRKPRGRRRGQPSSGEAGRGEAPSVGALGRRQPQPAHPGPRAL